MKKQYFYSLVASLMLLASPVILTSQEFTNFETRQMGDNISLVYSVEKEQLGQLFNIEPYYSVDGERTFRPMRTVWGNVGEAVSGGRNQLYVWDVLEDVNQLQGEVTFQLRGRSHSVAPLKEEFSDVIFELVSLHKIENNQIELELKITNTGKERDVKIFNRLISITGFNMRKYEAQWGDVGGVIGRERYSAPQRTLKEGETIKAVFRFHRIPDDLDRIMRLDVGAELLTITWGIDLEIGNMQFRDLPVHARHSMETPGRRGYSFETKTTASFNIEAVEIIDTTPPVLTFLTPSPDAIQEGVISVEDESFFIKGKAEDESGISQIVINGRSVRPGDDGLFETTVTLQSGKNEIVVRAEDTRFNSVEQKIAVHRKAPPGQQAFSDIQELDNLLATRRPDRNFALIVGVNDYPDPSIVPLQNPISDAKKLANVLIEHYKFEREDVIFMENPTRANIIDELDRLARRVSKDDNLLIFFAGHGYFDLQTELGYWLLQDASIQSTANWMANSQIRDYIGAIKSRHTLLIADACFSGGIFQQRRAFEEQPAEMDRVYSRPSRKAMTSGNLSEVPDESVFLRELVRRLEENTRSYILAEELFSSFKPIVVSQTSTEPQYGDIKGTGDEGGDFIFRRRN